MRNPRRQPGPIKRAVITPPVDSVSRNPLRRTLTDIAPSMPVRRSRAGSMAEAQGNDWGRTMWLRPTSAAMTPAWSRTKSN